MRIRAAGAAPPTAGIGHDGIGVYLRDHVGMGVIESARPAGPAGWVVRVGGRELALADEHQALIWVTAIGAYQLMEERGQSVPADWPRAGGEDGD